MENALGGPVDRTMTAEQVRRLVDEFGAESEFVDFKRKGAMLGGHTNRDKWRFECGKDVAAFANARGGVLIYGVRDAKTAEGDDQLDPFTAGEVDPGDLEDKFRRAVREVTAPVPGYDMFPVHDTDSFYMIGVVPPSTSAPHAVTMPGDGRSGLVYPSRAPGESQATYLREFQVAELYERRARSGENRRRRVEAVWAEGIDALESPGAPRVWLVVASVPDLPREDLLTEEAHAAIDQWDESAEPFPTLIQRGFIGVGGYSVPAPGRVCLNEMVRDEDSKHVYSSAVRHFYREIHADGSALAALPLSEPDTTSPFTIAIDDLVDNVATTTANTLEWTSARTGLWGSTTVTAGVVVTGTDTAVLKIDGYGDIDIRRTILRQVIGRWPRAVTTVQLADTVTMQERLVVAYRLATPLVQAFGVPRLAWLTPEGALRSHIMLTGGRQATAEWARRHDVPFDRS
jgi:Putative DNA-binding domain